MVKYICAFHILKFSLIWQTPPQIHLFDQDPKVNENLKHASILFWNFNLLKFDQAVDLVNLNLKHASILFWKFN